MKKLICIITILFTVVVSGCEAITYETRIIHNSLVLDKLNLMVDALETNNEAEVAKLFSNNVKDEIFYINLSKLIEYYDGEFVSLYHKGFGVFDTDEYRYYLFSFTVTTTKEVYQMTFKWYTKGSDDIKGISSFYIIKDNCDNTYRGDGMWTKGINIA